MVSKRKQIEELDEHVTILQLKLFEFDEIRYNEIEELKKRVSELESELEQCTHKK